MRIAAVVPAFNESFTVEPVVRALIASRSFTEVIVVDDGSFDATCGLSLRAGCKVLEQRPNGGKGQAMLIGVRYALSHNATAVGFFDADLLGFTTNHARGLASLYRSGKYEMVCGLRDYGFLVNRLQVSRPSITGERIVSKRVLTTMSLNCWQGYRPEVALNAVATFAKTKLVILKGVSIRTKSNKFGLVKGLKGDYRMFQSLWAAEKILRTSCGSSCE